MQAKLDFTVNTPKVKMEPPNLTGVKMIGLDTETTGLNWRGHDEPTGFGIYAPGRNITSGGPTKVAATWIRTPSLDGRTII